MTLEHKGLENLLEKFRVRESPKTGLAFIGICLLYKKEKYEFMLDDVFEEANNFLKKFNNVSNDIKIYNSFNFVTVLKEFQLLDIIETQNYGYRKKYTIKTDKITSDLIDLYFGKFVYVFINSYCY